MKLDRGIHENVLMTAYLGDLCPGPSVSGSGLAKIDAQSPAHFFAGWYGNPASEVEPTAATSLGSAAHCLILEGADAFAKFYRVKPEGMNFATKEGKAWRDNGDPREVVTYDDYLRIKNMAAGIAQSRTNLGLLTGARREVTLIDRQWFCDTEENRPIYLKSRPDAMNDKHRIAVNLKTCEDAREDAVRKALHNYDHYVSAALCLDMLKELTGEDWQYWLLFVEKSPPFATRRVTLKPTVLEWGRMRYRRAVAKFAECVKTGVWPGYADETIEADLPVWAEKQLQARHEAGEFNQAA
jgi:hypothetical protein